jgi:von Willebrand factor type A domain
MAVELRRAKPRAADPAGARAGRRRRTVRAAGSGLAVAALLMAANSYAPSGSVVRIPATATAADTVTPADIVSALNLQQVPVSYVVLVDVSGSMLADGLFSVIQSDFPDLVGQFGPKDSVAVDTFGDEPEVLRALAPVDQAPDPAQALDGVTVDPNADTDTGGALQLAYNQLDASPLPQVGVVLLLTDGKPDPPQSSLYYMAGINSKSSSTDLGNAIAKSGPWKALRQNYADLSQRMTLLGSGLALESGLDLSPVVDFVFPNAFVDDQPQVPTLHSFVQQAQTAAQTSEAANLLQADSGLGVSAQITPAAGPSWQGYPVGSGTATATVTFTDAGAHVPLQITNAQISSSGSLGVTASGLPPTITVTPGDPASYPVTLGWQSPDAATLFGGKQTVAAKLQVTGSVSAPWSTTIVSAFDKHYQVGTLTGSSVTLGGTVNGSINVGEWLLLVLALLVLAAAGTLRYLSTHKKLSGWIEIGAGSGFLSKQLPDSRRADLGLVTVGSETARVRVRSARRKRGGEPAFQIRCAPQGVRLPSASGRCEWAGSLILAGSWQFQHRPTAEVEETV